MRTRKANDQNALDSWLAVESQSLEVDIVGSTMSSTTTNLLVGAIFTLVPINASLRTNVIITGTTMPPKFVRQEGKSSLECPVDHPWAFDYGLKCCKTYKGLSRNQDLRYEHSCSSCENDKWITCPDRERRCRSRVDPVTCPESYPLGLIEEGCCESIVSRYDPDANPSCLGGILDPYSSPTCCSKLFEVNLCTERRQKCLSSKGLSKKINLTILDETTLYGTLYARYALTDSKCDKIYNNYWVASGSGRYFIIDYGYHIVPKKVILRNGHNAGYNDRATRNFKIYGSDIVPPSNQEPWAEWIELAEGSFPHPNTFGFKLCRVPLTTININSSRQLRYFKFHAITFFGFGASLQYIGIF